MAEFKISEALSLLSTSCQAIECAINLFSKKLKKKKKKTLIVNLKLTPKQLLN